MPSPTASVPLDVLKRAAAFIGLYATSRADKAVHGKLTAIVRQAERETAVAADPSNPHSGT